MKTYTASTYCDIIESCKPTAEELLPSQQTLFALLSSDKTSVINFVMKLIKQIADEKAFDFQSFADNFALCFATPKIAKSQLIGLGILENHYKKQVPSSPDYLEQLAVLFTIPDAKLQEKSRQLANHLFWRGRISGSCNTLRGLPKRKGSRAHYNSKSIGKHRKF